MGKGIDMARAEAPEHAAVLDDFKDQLLIVLLKRLGALEQSVVIPVAEADDTGQDLVEMKIEGTPPAFTFNVRKKS